MFILCSIVVDLILLLSLSQVTYVRNMVCGLFSFSIFLS